MQQGREITLLAFFIRPGIVLQEVRVQRNDHLFYGAQLSGKPATQEAV